jgi:glucan phosphoethanolaminetransferase (alkaline phosphatase superfamily)
MKTRNTKIILAIIALAISIISITTHRHFRSSSRRRVIIISMDTTRADYLSCYGYPHKTTPNIDAVAEEATRFEKVIARSRQPTASTTT